MNTGRGNHSLLSNEGGPLLRWYDAVKRDLPWRRTRDPYAIWVSEIMLQQTQVATVIPYWVRWMERFPTVNHLAKADEQEVLNYWQGLGYYRRCRLLLQGAKWVSENGLPTNAEEWLSVPGVGRYTAGAIASIALGLPAALVDGNVERVYARLTGDAQAGKALQDSAWRWAKKNLYAERPGDWNQALMELGATICTPTAPNCGDCPVMDRCVARQSWRVQDLPTKAPKVQVLKLRHIVWAPRCQQKWGLRQIPSGQWWEGMWEFPRTEDAIGAVEQLTTIIGPGWPESVGSFRHSVTHHRITIDLSLVRVDQPSADLEWFTDAEVENLPMPAPQRRILKLIRTNVGEEI